MEIDAEYSQAFRTKSYLDIITKLQDGDHFILSEHPAAEGCHHLIQEYINASYDAYDVCEKLLSSIRQLRVVGKRNSDDIPAKDVWASINNSVLVYGHGLRDMHVRNFALYEKLTSEKRGQIRKEKLRRIFPVCTKPTGVTLEAQMDIASKAIYILINEFDTIGVLVKRLREESDHCVKMAEICARLKMEEVVNEIGNAFREREPAFQEQVNELERHVYLCLNTIARGRNLVMESI